MKRYLLVFCLIYVAVALVYYFDVFNYKSINSNTLFTESNIEVKSNYLINTKVEIEEYKIGDLVIYDDNKISYINNITKINDDYILFLDNEVINEGQIEGVVVQNNIEYLSFEIFTLFKTTFLIISIFIISLFVIKRTKGGIVDIFILK